MLTKSSILTATALVLSVGMAAAQTCGGVYSVKRGDTLSQISDGLYKDARKWSAIYQNNRKKIGENPNNIRAGQKLNLTCIGGLPTGLEGGTAVTQAAAATTATAVATTAAAVTATQTSVSAAIKAVDGGTVRLVTADDFAPFTDRKLPQGGLITDIVSTALAGNDKVTGFKTYVVNDWAAHLDPLLTDAVFDMGFPWYLPDCASTPDNWRCQNLNYSDPMFEILILLFTSKERPFAFNSDADVVGKTLCRPNGYFTHDLEKNGRLWVSQNKITLKQPQSVADCFEMLEDGEVDAVAMNEFTGRTAIKNLKLEDKVNIVASRPLSIEGLHVVVGKEHPRSAQVLALINDGLDGIKASGDYQRIIDTHMSRIWGDF